jgi:hypothetical protein
MKKVLVISSVLLGVIFLAGCGQQPVAPITKTQSVVQSTTPNSETKKQTIKEYKSASTFSFNYPSQVCNTESNKCYPIVLTEDKSVITLDASDGGFFEIYYGTNITDEKSANNFLQTTLKNSLCKIDTAETNMLQGTRIKNVSLDGGCSLYRAYWETNSKEMIVYTLGRGSGCAFIDCELEGKISESINLGGVNVFNASMSGI